MLDFPVNGLKARCIKMCPEASRQGAECHHDLHVIHQASCSFLAAASEVASYCLLHDTLASLGSQISHLPVFSATPLAFQFLDSFASFPTSLDSGVLWSSVLRSLLSNPNPVVLSSPMTLSVIRMLVTPKVIISTQIFLS